MLSWRRAYYKGCPKCGPHNKFLRPATELQLYCKFLLILPNSSPKIFVLLNLFTLVFSNNSRECHLVTTPLLRVYKKVANIVFSSPPHKLQYFVTLFVSLLYFFITTQFAFQNEGMQLYYTWKFAHDVFASATMMQLLRSVPFTDIEPSSSRFSLAVQIL